MMGHVMNLFTQFVREQGGDEAVKKLQEAPGGRSEEYRFEEIYPEDEFTALVGSALSALEMTVPDLEESFARFFMRVSPEIFPAVFDLSSGARDLITRVPTLHRSIPSAASRERFKDKLIVQDERENSLLLRYDSPHKLCVFLQHLCQLALDHYGETGRIEEHECAREGADACLVEIHFTGKQAG